MADPPCPPALLRRPPTLPPPCHAPHPPSISPPRKVNPLAEDTEGRLIAADAKLGFDDNAAFRQKEIFALKDDSQIDPRRGRGDREGAALGLWRALAAKGPCAPALW